MGRGSARRWSAVLLAGLVAGAALSPGPASAHGSLATSDPAQGSAVAEPLEAVSLTFTEKPAPFAYLTVTAPTGDRVDSGWSNAEPVRLATPVTEYQLTDGAWQPLRYNTGFPVKITVTHWPAPGPYVVRYHSVASDGDQVKGEVTFTYTGAAGPAPAGWQAPADQPSAELLAAAGPSASGPAAGPAQVRAQPQPAAAGDDAGFWVWLVPVLLVVAAGLIYLMIRPPSFRSARPAEKSRPKAR
jgi:methionine-rich copper-binding protein CopC